MRRLLICWGWLLATGGLAIPAAAQAPPKVVIDAVRIGYPSGADPDEALEMALSRSYHKSGFWAPVYVSLTPGPEGIKSGRVIVETDDADDVRNTYTTPLPSGGLPPDVSYTAVTYVKVGSLSSEVVVTVQADDRSREVKSAPNAIGADDLIILGIGSRLPGLQKALFEESQKQQHVGARGYCAYIDRDVHDLPDRWFGYDCADLVILTTSRREFVTELLNEREHRKEALSEWVRRGGKLVISCGHNQDMLPEILSRLQLDMPVTSSKPLHLDEITGLDRWMPSNIPRLTGGTVDAKSGKKAGPVEIAQLERKPGGRDLEIIAPSHDTANSPWLVVRSSQGLGQVTLVAFDLDSGPFVAWKGQATFWKQLQSLTRTTPVTTAQNPNQSLGLRYAERRDVGSTLGQLLDQFPNVSVISFGWVALFILIYIIIVGPLDYLFLKKVVKRLELTWITFPTVVLAVSAGAYFAAYHLKGNDLRINKLDLVDLDIQGQRAYGTTWFSMFSPRIQLYTVGIEPIAPIPGDPAAKNDASVVVSWMGRQDLGFGGVNRPRSQGLFRRTYEFESDARGLKNVPIQVWTSKAFDASWEQPLPANQPPIRSSLRHTSADSGLVGSITSNLPMALEDVVIIAGEKGNANPKIIPLGTLTPGQAVQIGSNHETTNLGSWSTAGSADDRQPPTSGLPSMSTSAIMRNLMFHHSLSQNAESNRAYSYLDQAWRRNLSNEATLIGSIPATAGAAEPINAGTSVLSRLWLGDLPGGSSQRPPLVGTIWQKTYVRAYLPIQRARDTESDSPR